MEGQPGPSLPANTGAVDSHFNRLFMVPMALNISCNNLAAIFNLAGTKHSQEGYELSHLLCIKVSHAH